MKLINRVILITGGTSGIGYELVKQLAPVNIAIIVIGRNTLKLQALRTAFDNIAIFQCSIEKGSDLESTISDIIRSHPNISVIFNNAGVQETTILLDNSFKFDSIDHEISVNLSAPVKICSLMLKPLLRLGSPSAIVNISSGLALFPKKTSAVYCATKAGIHSFTQSLRYQLEGTSIAVYEAILPLVDTPMTEGRGKGKISASAAARAIIAGVEKDQPEIYIGKARLMPLLSRLSPSLMAKIMKSA